MRKRHMSLSIAQNAKKSSLFLSTLSSQEKIKVIKSIKELLVANQKEIRTANEKDIFIAKSQKMSDALIKRLDLFLNDKFQSMINGLDDVCKLDDPIGKTTLCRELDSGLILRRITVPIGVILVIFEARPEVLVQISSLCIKSGNSAILKGGKESHHTNEILSRIINQAIALQHDYANNWVQYVGSRELVHSLISEPHLAKYLSLCIPRGSKQLVEYVQKSALVPVLGHADGLCSIYVDCDADIEMAVKCVVDSKTNYPSACNSAETLLIHESVLETHLPAIVNKLIDAGVQIKCDEQSYSSLELIKSDRIVRSIESDYHTEFIDLIIAVRVVKNVTEAVEHIHNHGSGHTDAIITTNEKTADWFITRVDSAGVYWNASTRFADGFRYGFGAEIGVSTNKTHARGPVGLEGLTIYKYTLVGNGHIVSEYGSGKKQYHHKDIISIFEFNNIKPFA